MRKNLKVAVWILLVPAICFALSPMTSVWIRNSQIDSTPIGQNTPAAITGTSVTATSGFTGNLTGNASTANSLAGSPTTCGGAPATGISANGNAICGTPTTMAFPANSFSTTYTNGSARKAVAVTGNCSCNVGHFSQITAYVNGQQVAANGTTNGGGLTSVTFVVPPGATYSVTFSEVGTSGGALSLSSWVEWVN